MIGLPAVQAFGGDYEQGTDTVLTRGRLTFLNFGLWPLFARTNRDSSYRSCLRHLKRLKGSEWQYFYLHLPALLRFDGGRELRPRLTKSMATRSDALGQPSNRRHP